MKLYNVLMTGVFLLFTSLAFSQNHTKMKLNDLHDDTTGVHTNMMFPATAGKVISLQILKNNQLKEHITNVPALLVCVTGHAVFEDEKGISIKLLSGEYVKIEPNVKHWVNGVEDSQLLLIK